QLLRGSDAGEIETGSRTALEDQSLFLVPVQDRLHRVIDRQDEACRHLLFRCRSDVEPDRRVETEHLVQQHPGHLVFEHLGIRRAGEVSDLGPRGDVGRDNPVDQLLEAVLPARRSYRAAKVLARHDVRRVDGPELRELDTSLLEVHRPVPPIGHHDIAALPGHLVIRVHTGRRVHPWNCQALATSFLPDSRFRRGVRHHAPLPPGGRCGHSGTDPCSHSWEPSGSFPALSTASRSPSISFSKSSIEENARYTLANRRYATVSSSRNGPRIASPTSWLGISASPPERIDSSTRCASSCSASSSTGRPWHARRTPRTTLSRLNCSVTPERLTTASTIDSEVVNLLPHSEQERRRRIACPSSTSRESTTLESVCRQNGHHMTGHSPQALGQLQRCNYYIL